MAIVDGSPAPQNITATVDPYQVASLVREMQKQDAASQKKESRFQQKINSLLQTGNVDKDNLSEIADLTQRAMDDVKEELKSNAAPDMVKMTQSRYNDMVTDALDKYIEGDDPLEKSAKLLEYNVSEKLKNNRDFMEKFHRGELDKRQIATIAKDVVETFSKDVLKRDQSAKGPAITTGVPSSVANQAIENGPPAGSIDEIVEPHRRESFLKLKSAGQRWGKMTQENAEKWAFKHATRNYKKQGSAA